MRNDLFLKHFGKKIREKRLAKGLRLYELSKMCNIYDSALSAIELGKSNSYILTLKKIADVLEIDIKEIL
jgi:transcriptional regulator with XRE-family HTH domain